jgi:hypothetical protein
MQQEEEIARKNVATTDSQLYGYDRKTVASKVILWMEEEAGMMLVLSKAHKSSGGGSLARLTGYRQQSEHDEIMALSQHHVARSLP